MTEREIKAKEAITDIRSGMSDRELMEKYRLTPQGLENLRRELDDLGLLHTPSARDGFRPPRQRIRIREIVKDISASMSDIELMEKYRISRHALQVLFKKLLDLKAIDRDTLFGEVGIQYETAVSHFVRELQRYSLDFEIPVYLSENPQIQGRLRDLSEKGVGVEGLEVETEQIKTLVILGDAFGVVAPFDVEAECRWSRREGPEQVVLAGFKILALSDTAREELRKLIKLTSFGT
ncbi:MAG: PilZ domain-containing protein [Desulfomonile tiedjei]|nr:PilZ domain-containing protein [Desulfomonile tiedjei]